MTRSAFIRRRVTRADQLAHSSMGNHRFRHVLSYLAAKGMQMGLLVGEDAAVQIMALTILAEAGGEPYDGKVAVGCVIRNRANTHYFGNSVIAVCLWPLQFSCWNSNGPEASLRRRIIMTDPADNSLAGCVKIAQAVCSNQQVDITNGSRHYHTRQVHPYWAQGKRPVFEVGNHLFYNDID